MKVPVKLYFDRELYDKINETRRDGEKFSDTVFRLLKGALRKKKKE